MCKDPEAKVGCEGLAFRQSRAVSLRWAPRQGSGQKRCRADMVLTGSLRLEEAGRVQGSLALGGGMD